jgi:hypothetical protein
MLREDWQAARSEFARELQSLLRNAWEEAQAESGNLIDLPVRRREALSRLAEMGIPTHASSSEATPKSTLFERPTLAEVSRETSAV